MYIDFSHRQSGKTTRLLNFLRENPKAFLITFSHMREVQLQREHAEFKERISCPECYKIKRLAAFHDEKVSEIYIDDAELVLREVFDKPVTKISISHPENIQ